MENREVKIKSMWDFVELFLAMYSKDNQKDNKVQISKNMKMIINSIMNNINLNHEEFGEGIYTLDDKFNITLFLDRLKYCNIKDGWRDDLVYDFENDCISINVSKSKIKKTLDNSNPSSIMLMSHIVSLYEVIDKHLSIIENERIEKITLKYME